MTPAVEAGLQVRNALTRELMPEQIGPEPRALAVPEELQDTSLRAMRYQSPLRYPGAKSGLAPLITELITRSSESIGRPQLFVEPFAGGASTSLRLAAAGNVDRILLADSDLLVTRFWQVAAADTEWLIDRMWEEPVTLDRWDHWRSWTPPRPDDREIAMKCLFLNRTTFSGILHGRAGPIGGRQQASKYSIGCRFNKAALEARLRFVGALYNSNRLVDVWCKDWQATLRDVVEWYPQLLPNRVIAYLDPPYWNKSSKLYRRSFDPAGGYPSRANSHVENGWVAGMAHYALAEYLRRRAQLRWILSYDHYPELTSQSALYANDRMTPSIEDTQLLGVRSWYISKRVVDLHYSAAFTAKFRGKRQELLLTTLPPGRVPMNDQFRPLAAAGAL
jgi:DNA adenine methylase